ncbi:glycosyltransferase family 2 protein [Pedobacter cryophilus]|uniref:Glycosyltransferase family 2 protein n=1 Tax=Pedobacter cryophilus TaxID=2571271 RepID=A0A4U1BYI1_9SPHI|nr:glycosyltransferase family 2 protein [Pedobacter cryophilus]TKB97785.1 glycosyltransferase family 2 protein [Pedobacter cryophilus]
MNQSQITVSVLMAVYNTPFEFAKRAIDSVLNQDLQNFELIILDDGSNLALGEQLLQYCQINESKLTYIRIKNNGQSQAINRGVQFTRGKYIAIIDADDEYKPNHLSSCLKEMQFADLTSSLTETIVNHEDDYYVPDKHDYKKNIHVDDCILFATLFGKKEVFKEIGFKNMYAADSHFYEQAAEQYLVKKLNIRTYIYYRNVSGSITAKLKEEQLLAS